MLKKILLDILKPLQIRDEKNIERIFKNFSFRNYEKGDIIFEQGSIPEHFVFVLDGLLAGKILNKVTEQRYSILFFPGRWCCEEYLYENYPLSLNMIAEVESNLIEIPFSILREVIATESHVGEKFLNAIAIQAVRQNYITLRRLYSNAIGKIFYTLLFLVEGNTFTLTNVRTDDEIRSDRLTINISQECLGKVSAAGRTTTSNLLKYFEMCGLLKVGYNRIDIHHLDQWLQCAHREAFSTEWDSELTLDSAVKKLRHEHNGGNFIITSKAPAMHLSNRSYN